MVEEWRNKWLLQKQRLYCCPAISRSSKCRIFTKTARGFWSDLPLVFSHASLELVYCSWFIELGLLAY